MAYSFIFTLILQNLINILNVRRVAHFLTSPCILLCDFVSCHKRLLHASIDGEKFVRIL